MTLTDTLLCAADDALRTLFAAPRARRPNPAAGLAPVDLSPSERAEAGAQGVPVVVYRSWPGRTGAADATTDAMHGS
jgi:hypothetical protein